MDKINRFLMLFISISTLSGAYGWPNTPEGRYLAQRAAEQRQREREGGILTSTSRPALIHNHIIIAQSLGISSNSHSSAPFTPIRTLLNISEDASLESDEASTLALVDTNSDPSPIDIDSVPAQGGSTPRVLPPPPPSHLGQTIPTPASIQYALRLAQALQNRSESAASAGPSIVFIDEIDLMSRSFPDCE